MLTFTKNISICISNTNLDYITNRQQLVNFLCIYNLIIYNMILTSTNLKEFDFLDLSGKGID